MPLTEDAKDSARLIRDYVKQETIDQVIAPLTRLNLYSFLAGLGFAAFVFFGALAELRGLQTAPLFRGTMSWLAYVIVAFSVVAGSAVIVALFSSSGRKRRG
jgi:hypothetical protein